MKISIVTDSYPSETTWEVNDINGNLIWSGGPYVSMGYNYVHEKCFGVPGTYTFIIKDSYGDGLVGDGYKLFIDNVAIESGSGSFSTREFDFVIGSSTTSFPPTTTFSPTLSPSNLPSSSPTEAPEPTAAPTREVITEVICLESNYKYKFSISDSFGDGMCCVEVSNQ